MSKAQAQIVLRLLNAIADAFEHEQPPRKSPAKGNVSVQGRPTLELVERRSA